MAVRKTVISSRLIYLLFGWSIDMVFRRSICKMWLSTGIVVGI
jgi:hypothetical protein